MLENIKYRLKQNSILLEKELEKYYPTTENTYNSLIEAQRYALLEGGKRIRAFLILEICDIFGGNRENVIPYACAIEMIHASSLIHDDLPCMDNDDIRRGKPSTHIRYGEAIALLAGDAMLVKAFEAVASNNLLSAQANVEAVKILSVCTGTHGMLAGQTIDILPTPEATSLDDIINLHKLKTGMLISASVELGCLGAGIEKADPKRSAAMKYAENIGLAFQIIDDILDFKDGKNDTNSFLSFMTVKEASEFAQKLTDDAISSMRPYDNGTFEDLANYLIARKF